jgi:hypothetical protein
MIKRYLTESGSTYTIDFEKKTWERNRGAGASTMRSDFGTFLEFSTTYGYIEMVCPPINPPFPRLITSTNIILEEEV